MRWICTDCLYERYEDNKQKAHDDRVRAARTERMTLLRTAFARRASMTYSRAYGGFGRKVCDEDYINFGKPPRRSVLLRLLDGEKRMLQLAAFNRNYMPDKYYERRSLFQHYGEKSEERPNPLAPSSLLYNAELVAMLIADSRYVKTGLGDPFVNLIRPGAEEDAFLAPGHPNLRARAEYPW